MHIKRNLFVATLALAAVAAAGSASAQTRWERHHPRQDQVLDRNTQVRRHIIAERREGDISPAKAHRLLVKNRQIARREHHMAHANGGYITRAQQQRLNHRQTRVAHRIP